jgi:xanthine dehydrogenase accessory factor
VRYGVTDEAAWAVGLTCGGSIEIFIEPLAPDAILAGLRDAIEHERLVGMVTVIDGPGVGARLLVGPGGRTTGDLGTPELAECAARLATEHFAHFSSGRRTQPTGSGEVELFFETQAPRSKLIVVGAVHVAVPLVQFAAALGFHTTVIDPRSAFASEERFAHADELIVDWPQDALPRIGLNEASCVAVLTHDVKVDLPALVCALRSPARYVGVLGSRKTHAGRVRALREAGLSEEQIGRIRAPIGLALGGRRPAEIAVAIIAEIVAAAHGKNAGDPA